MPQGLVLVTMLFTAFTALTQMRNSTQMQGLSTAVWFNLWCTKYLGDDTPSMLGGGQRQTFIQDRTQVHSNTIRHTMWVNRAL